MKKLFALFCIIVMSVMAFAAPCLSVRGTRNTVCASYSYGCAGVYSDDLTVYLNLENASRGITVVRVQVEIDNGTCQTQTVYISSGEDSGSATFRIGSGNCAKVAIIEAYVK